MNIIKEGKRDNRTFTCPRCKCIFMASIKEYTEDMFYTGVDLNAPPDGIVYTATCPWCNKVVDDIIYDDKYDKIKEKYGAVIIDQNGGES